MTYNCETLDQSGKEYEIGAVVTVQGIVIWIDKPRQRGKWWNTSLLIVDDVDYPEAIQVLITLTGKHSLQVNELYTFQGKLDRDKKSDEKETRARFKLWQASVVDGAAPDTPSHSDSTVQFPENAKEDSIIRQSGAKAFGHLATNYDKARALLEWIDERYLPWVKGQ